MLLTPLDRICLWLLALLFRAPYKGVQHRNVERRHWNGE